MEPVGKSGVGLGQHPRPPLTKATWKLCVAFPARADVGKAHRSKRTALLPPKAVIRRLRESCRKPALTRRRRRIIGFPCIRGPRTAIPYICIACLQSGLMWTWMAVKDGQPCILPPKVVGRKLRDSCCKPGQICKPHATGASPCKACRPEERISPSGRNSQLLCLIF